MSDTFIRHLIAFIGLLVAVLIYVSAYFAGSHGYWWAGFGTLFIYFIVYKLVDV